MRIRKTWSLLIGALASGLLLSGCGSLTAASSMRVDVDVYKGPLMKPMAVQWAELQGFVQEATSSFAAFEKQYRMGYVTDEWWKTSCSKSSYLIDPVTNGKSPLLLAPWDRHETDKTCYQSDGNLDPNPKMRDCLASASSGDKREMVIAPPACAVMGDLYSVWKEMKYEVDVLKFKLSSNNTNHQLDHIARINELANLVDKRIKKKIFNAAKDQTKDKAENQQAGATTKDKAKGQQDQTKLNELWSKIGELQGKIDQPGQNLKPLVADIQKVANTLSPMNADIRHNTAKLAALISSRTDLSNKMGTEETLLETIRVATKLKTVATSLVGFNMSYIPNSEIVRTNMVSLATLAAEVASQLGSRATVLMSQHQGNSRNNMATADFLTDATSTEYANLHHWLDATYPPGGIGTNPPSSLTPMNIQYADQASRTPALDRIRTYERLYQNQYWSHVNSVQANGAGTVRMALIKDDIGNWNLKSFDSDPTELMASYTKFGLSVAKLAGEMITNGASATMLSKLNLATTTTGEQKVAVLQASHNKSADELKELQKYYDAQKDANPIKATKTAIQTIKTILENHQSRMNAL